MTSLDDFKKTYFEECGELLDQLYAGLADIAEGRGDNETLHAVFRAVHSIKGGGGAFGFARLVSFAHAFETLLDMMRDGRIGATPEVAALLVRATDTLSDLIDAARTGQERPPGFEAELVQALQAAAGGDTPAPRHDQAPAEANEPAGTTRYCIRFAPHPDLFQRANDPLLLIRALKRLGPVAVEPDLARLPDLSAIDPEQAYLAWTIHLATASPRTAVEEVFEFAADDCDLSIALEPDADTGAAAARAESAVTGKANPAAQPTPGRTSEAAGEQPHSIRVDVEKVDRVVNLVGELVISQAALAQFGQSLPPDLCPALLNGLETLSQHLRELQESVMAIRAQPVKSVFSRMPRLVRELASQLGKEVRLVVTGEATEIDKTVIEQLADPLTHLLRNALDHGIESPELREANGKPRQGTVHLGAEQRSGRILIEIADDGQGIDRPKLLARARQRGLVAKDAVPTEEEIDNLVFAPGLSTATNVSQVSGRGVGMDVVKRNMQALGGRIIIESRSGTGSRFILSLPLTLAILDGMTVAVGQQTYIVPITNIVESLRPRRADIHSVVGRGDVLAIRGEYVPLLYLHCAFGVADAETDPCRGIIVIVEGEGRRRIGLVVDELLGQQQVVVKSLEANYDSVDGIGGATILGNGRVALILDVSGLSANDALAVASRAEPPPPPPPHVLQ